MNSKREIFHGLSIDVEDWFHILDCEQAPPCDAWTRLESRINTNIERILNLLDTYKIQATFFVLGWVAEHYPEIIRRILNSGHEIGSHGYSHQMVTRQTRDQFAKDLDQSLDVISSITGQEVTAYRAPGFSISHDQLWAFDVLASRGIKTDSSIFIGPHAHGGLPIKRSSPFEIILGSGTKKIIEFPIIPFSFLSSNIPFSGGGYLRLLPTSLVKKVFSISENQNKTLVVYLHPREFDLNQPKMNLPIARKFKYYVGISNFYRKINELLESFQFDSLRNIANKTALDQPLLIC